MTNRQITANLNLLRETRRILTNYGWSRSAPDAYLEGFTLEGAVYAAGRIRNVSTWSLLDVMDAEVTRRTNGRQGMVCQYEDRPTRRQSQIWNLLDTVERQLESQLNG